MGSSETLITRSILQWLNMIGVAFKVHSSGMQGRGTPDIAGVVEGRAILIEVKTEKGIATTIQKYKLAKLEQAGAICGIVRSLQEAKHLLAKHGLPTNREDHNEAPHAPHHNGG